MLLILVEGNAFNTSGAYNEFPKWGRRPKAAGPPPLYAPLVLKALAAASIKSIGHYLFNKHWPTTCFKSRQN